MSSALQHAFRNSPKDKPKPNWLHHLLDRTPSDVPPQSTPGSSAPDANVNKENSHEARPGVPAVKAHTEELAETKKIGESNVQAQATPDRKAQDEAQHSTRKHLEPRDARVLPDQEQARHHLASMDSLPSTGHMAKSWNDQPVVTNGHASKTPEPESLSKFDELSGKFSKSVAQLKTVLKAIRDPLPTDTGDGSQLPPEPRESTKQILGDILKDLAAMGPDKVQNLITVATKAQTHGVLDDRKYYMERLIQATSMLPQDAVSTKLTSGFLTQLWDDLSHPPQTLLSDDYQYRQPDGSKNNYLYPQLGASDMPYARTVPRKEKLPGCLPDPGILFDATMARKDPKGVPHPNKISSMLFYFASIIIHDIFKTDHTNFNISRTSSYLDLGPLYGNNWEEQKQMRTFQDGKIRPDCFSEPRLLTFPAGVGAILIMFNRYHNHVVEQLAAINEGGRFSVDPRKVTVPRYGEEINKRDDDLFQTGRLITCALYVNFILIDYVRTILNLNRTDEDWQLNPRMDIPGGPPRGTGNQVSAEFNLVYRWHAAVSEKDDRWTQQLFKEISPNMSAADAAKKENIVEFLKVLGHKEAEFTAQSPPDRQWPALKEEVLKRSPSGHFADADLTAILTSSVEDCANAYGPQQVPTVMKAIEILGIQQARTWQVATLNEFRSHFGLQPYRKFEDITDNKEVSEALKHLYDTPDNVELYPGLVIEDAKRPTLPGSGLCPGYTVSRGVLSDAVALVRGDRFYTTNYTPAALTNWGYQESSSDVAIDNGCVFYKLFQRALPDSYDPASIYTHYPFTVPHGQDGMAEVLERLGKAHKYTDLVDSPAPISQPTAVYSYEAVAKVLKDSATYHAASPRAAEDLLGLTKPTTKPSSTSKPLLRPALYPKDWQTAIRTFYTQKTAALLKQKSYALAGTPYADLVRDIGNLVPVHFAAEIFTLPLRTAEFEVGILTERQLYTVLAAVAAGASGVDAQQTFPLRQQAGDLTRLLRDFVRGVLRVVGVGGDVGEWIGTRLDPIAPELKAFGVPMLRKLAEQAGSQGTEALVAEILATAGSFVTTQGLFFAQAMDFFLSAAGKDAWAQVQALVNGGGAGATAETDDKLLRYLLEATRLNGCGGSVARTAMTSASLTDTPSTLPARTHTLKPATKILLNLATASQDPSAFPTPASFSPERPVEAYLHLAAQSPVL
ncbi:hypothetical protein LTR53_009992, partial [Teratosphaeriaceae sp. CCFEE 6253]